MGYCNNPIDTTVPKCSNPEKKKRYILTGHENILGDDDCIEFNSLNETRNFILGRVEQELDDDDNKKIRTFKIHDLANQFDCEINIKMDNGINKQIERRKIKWKQKEI